METALGIAVGVLALVAAYFYARSSKLELAGQSAVADEKAEKVSALEKAAKAQREEEKNEEALEKAKVDDAASAAEFLSNSFGRRGPLN